ncbi:hypothetical protein RHGRI_001446 [Rhododendron griersonianum]|uniref:Uncharacterized protein n=1 Tax=Rhododendron griersonianum TaxID=479676 RepID=A0AAV6LK82_9ERIC|nr:hypothetical protein RHGRI_001446 [Rhododendron griersonianum]
MASKLLVIGQNNALVMACLDQGLPRHDSRHAKTKGWPRHGKQIAFHRERQCIAHGMPTPRVTKAWQADGLSPGNAMHRSW